MSIKTQGKFNELGQATNCHFLQERKRRNECSVLVDFYNVSDDDAQCKGCPFFKTDEEFNKGWKRRANNT